MMKQKKLKSSTSISSEDLSSLAIFKSVLSESGALRNHSTKLKLHEIKFSGLDLPHPASTSQSNRRDILRSLVSTKIGGVGCRRKLEGRESKGN